MPPRKKAAPKKAKTFPRPVYFETTIPVIRPCRHCGVWLAAGVAEGSKAEIEFVPLDLGQQIWALLNGINLYCFRRSGLVYMDASRLSGKHFGSLYPQHRCSVKWPSLPPGDPAVLRPNLTDTPPY